MFIIIEPSQHGEYKSLISELHGQLLSRDLMHLDKTDQNNTTYFIATTPQGKYRGGAYLIKRSPDKILVNPRLIAKHAQNCNHIWSCGGIHIVCDKPDFFSELASIFYSELYKQLVHYSKKININKMCIHNTFIEKENIKQIGKWPMVGQIIDVYNCNMFYSFMNLKEENENL